MTFWRKSWPMYRPAQMPPKPERKGPADSATKHAVGDTMVGNDGRTWKVITTAAGIHRWSPSPGPKPSPSLGPNPSLGPKPSPASASGGCGCSLVAGGAAPATRKGPSESATRHPPGTKKKGNDGRMWVVAETKAGVKRWKPAPTKKGAARKSPMASATGFDAGAKRRGRDGRTWVIAVAKNGTKRWKPVTKR